MTRCDGRVVPFESLYETARFVGGESCIERGRRVHAELLPACVKASSRSRSSQLNRTTYFLTAISFDELPRLGRIEPRRLEAPHGMERPAHDGGRQIGGDLGCSVAVADDGKALPRRDPL